MGDIIDLPPVREQVISTSPRLFVPSTLISNELMNAGPKDLWVGIVEQNNKGYKGKTEALYNIDSAWNCWFTFVDKIGLNEKFPVYLYCENTGRFNNWNSIHTIYILKEKEKPRLILRLSYCNFI